MAAGGMYDHAGGLIDHHQILVLVGDLERRLLVGHQPRLEDRVVDLDRLPGHHQMAFGHERAVDADPAGVDQVLGSGARSDRPGQEAIEPGAGGLFGDAQLGPAVRAHDSALTTPRRTPWRAGLRVPTGARARQT